MKIKYTKLYLNSVWSSTEACYSAWECYDEFKHYIIQTHITNKNAYFVLDDIIAGYFLLKYPQYLELAE